MTKFFIDHIQNPLIFTKGEKIIQANQAAQALFPQLAENDSQWLREKTPHTQGKLTQSLKTYHYEKVTEPGASPQETQVMYQFREWTELGMNPGQLDRMLAEIREELSDLGIQTERIREGEEPEYPVLNRSLLRLERLVNNSTLLQEENFRMKKESFNLAQFLHHLCQEVTPHLNDLEVELSYDKLPEGVQVMGNPTYLTRAILGIFANAIPFSQKITLQLQETKTTALLQIQDDSKKPLARTLEEMLTGYRKNPQPKPHEGAGMGLPVIWKIVSAMGGTALAEEREEGGLQITIALPLATKKNKELASKERFPTFALEDKPLNDQSQILLELSTVLNKNFYTNKDVD